MSILLRSFLLPAVLAAAGPLLAAQTDTAAQAIARDRLAVDGVPPERLADLTRRLQSRRSHDRDSIEAEVRHWYAAQGYLHAEVAVDTSTLGTWILKVVEGPPALVERIDIEGVPAVEAKTLRELLTLRHGARFSPGILERDIAAILDHAEKTGRPLATVSVDEFDETERDENCSVSIVLRLVPGPALTIGSIRVAGHTSTTASTVRRASGLREGDPWTSRSSVTAVRRLRRTGLFTNVGEPAVELNEQQRLVVTLPVTEGRHSSFDGMIGFLPPTAGTGSATVTGLADVRLGNLLGTARALSLQWFQERQGTQEIDLAYREPWLLGSEIGADLDFHQRKQDSLYVRQQMGLGASGHLDEDVTLGVSYAQTTTTPIEGYGVSVLSSSDQWLLGVRFAYDTRDDALTPRSGALYGADVMAGRKHSNGVGGSVRTSVQKLRVDLAFALSRFAAQTSVLEAHGVDVRSGTLDAADLMRLGGATSLRGYREAEFLGSRLAWGTLEHRFFFSPRSFIGAFIDGGFIHRPALASIGLLGSDLFRFGYGVTLRVDAPVGLLGISIALGEGDGFGDAKLHVRVQSEF